VLLSCNDGENETGCGDGNQPECLTQRAQAIDRVLTALAVPHAIVSNELAFKQALRSRNYNTYWLSGKQDKLHDDLAAELREAVFGGDGLILDGVHDERNKTLDVIPGVLFRGKVGEDNLPVDISGPDFEPQRLQSIGRVAKVVLAGGTQQGAFDGRTPNANGPAIVSHVYGRGRAVLFAFDLVIGLAETPPWEEVLGSALHYVQPRAAGGVAPGAFLPFKTSISNLAKAVDLTVKSQLPAGAKVAATTPAAVVDAAHGTVEWHVSLAEAQSADLLLALRAPVAAGDFAMQTTISTVRNGAQVRYGDILQQTFQVSGGMAFVQDVKSDLNALALPKNKDFKTRDRIVAIIQSVPVEMARRTPAGYGAAISALLQAVDALNSLPVDTRHIHDSLDVMLREAQWLWSQQQGKN
jgi:hypothetical protein